MQTSILEAKRPSFSDRAFSSPEGLHVNILAPANGDDSVNSKFSNLLTPPISPAFSRFSRSSIDLSIADDELRSEITRSQDIRKCDSTGSPYATSVRTQNGTLLCPYEVVILTDTHDRKQTFGYGAWSTVYKGTCRPARAYSSGLATPPPTHNISPPVLVAVKCPARNDAKPILESEAQILSYLAGEAGYQQYVVSFYGIIPGDSSIVLAAIPTSLEDHIRNSAMTAKVNRTTSNMTWPVVGTEKVWLSLAFDLITALSWLHNEAMVVHGDIKPGNILLGTSMGLGIEEEGRFPYRPVFTDFSSSQLLTTNAITLNTLSAVTREYTAPELLSSKVLKDPKSTATTASDVFSLAVTLLVAATGNTRVYTGSIFQRQAMATQGWGIIGMVKNSDDGMRIPRQGFVERVVEKAVLKHNVGRIDAQNWRDMVDKMMHGDPSKYGHQDSRWG